MAKNKQSIDLSKISNLDAVNKVEPAFEEKVEAATFAKKNKNNKFNFTEPETIPLPSGGRLYKSVTTDKDVLKGFIKMVPMTLKEEEILSTPRFLKSGSATRMILDRCIVSDIDAKDILLFDSNFLMFYLRSISYGDEYKFDIKCENVACEKKFKHTVNITELEFKELPEDVKEPIEVALPKSKFTVSFILPRLSHSEELALINKNRKKSTDSEDTNVLDNLLVTTISVKDTEGNEIDEEDWPDFFSALPGMDVAELREKSSFSTGVDEIKGIVCPYCETEQDTTIPIGLDFFRF